MGWLTFGGAQRQALYFADYLRNKGYRISFVGLSSPGILSDICKAHQIECHFYPISIEGKLRLQSIVRIVKFGRFLRGLKPDYLAPYCMPPNIACGIVWRFTGARRCVWQQRDEGRLRQNPSLEKLAIRLTPHFISNSYHAADWLSKELSIQTNEITVIKNGIPIPAKIEKGLFRRDYNISPNRIVVTMLANIHKYKDHGTLLSAWSLLINKWQGSDEPLLILAGKHEDAYPTVSAFIESNSLRSSVICPGIIQETSSLLADSDIMAFSSISEGCPNAVLEGMAAGLPIVATDIPAIREAVGDFGTCLLSPPKDAINLAVNLVQAIKDEALRSRQSDENIKRIKSCFSLNEMCNQTLLVYTGF